MSLHSSLADTINFLTQQRQIPAASPEFLGSVRNPNIRNFGPGQQPQFTDPILQQFYNAPGQAVRGAGNFAGGALSSLANFLGMQAVRPEMAIRENVDDNVITRTQRNKIKAIEEQSQ